MSSYLIENVKVADVYYIKGFLDLWCNCLYSEDFEVYHVSDFLGKSKNLFCDSLTQEFSGHELSKNKWILEIRYKDGVVDPAEESIKKALEDLGDKVEGARTGKRYYIEGRLEKDQVKEISKILSNEMIEDCFSGFEKVKIQFPKFEKGNPIKKMLEMPILNADDEKLKLISKENMLALSLEEMKAIQKYFISKKQKPF